VAEVYARHQDIPDMSCCRMFPRSRGGGVSSSAFCLASLGQTPRTTPPGVALVLGRLRWQRVGQGARHSSLAVRYGLLALQGGARALHALASSIRTRLSVPRDSAALRQAHREP
jgi:hypothetical protein